MARNHTSQSTVASGQSKGDEDKCVNLPHQSSVNICHEFQRQLPSRSSVCQLLVKNRKPTSLATFVATSLRLQITEMLVWGDPNCQIDGPRIYKTMSISLFGKASQDDWHKSGAVCNAKLSSVQMHKLGLQFTAWGGLVVMKAGCAVIHSEKCISVRHTVNKKSSA